MSTSGNSSSGRYITWTHTGSGFGGWIYTVPNLPTQCEPEKKEKIKDGCDCKKCKEFYPYAEPNQDDGTLLCYKCRIGW